MEEVGRQGRSELEPRKNFSVRLSPALYNLLAARRSEGRSMNDVIGDALAAYVDRPELAPAKTGSDLGSNITRDAIRQGPEAIPALKGIAKHAMNLKQVNLACVLWASSARLISATEGAEKAAEELAHSAEIAEASRHYELAVALWREAMQLDPNNLEVANRLGQRLHHLAVQHDNDLERLREAERLLARVTFVDNHAKLFHGWAALMVAEADKAVDQRDRALAEVDEALKAWAFGQRQSVERSRWLRQVQRLAEAGYRPRACDLIEFANRNARWEPLHAADLEKVGSGLRQRDGDSVSATD